ncbi:damage-inducible protein DinB [Chryseobacterium sp. 09-1422]|uniref:Damage-inducible protein DinB n=1 Tax=Chryseobacterium kimseyorum TaxID=2984028 RepID=A0ABT3I481_9FLAO|nr:DinB family protein [Chryseobacterium kimseyorum]MCW3170852.1 damage-inducible protein DinB [Chryseobacterium kimseyorum]
MTTTATATTQFISSAQLLEHWQGHRNLTRRVIEMFPEKDLFEFSIGGMRPFAKLAVELISIAGPALKGIVEGQMEEFSEEAFQPKTKEEILAKWDSETEVINQYFNQISEERFQETFNLFGQYEFPVYQNILYFVDNEVHHRGQGFVYLRALGIEPPFFWERFSI